jgi:hypothetical protein
LKFESKAAIFPRCSGSDSDLKVRGDLLTTEFDAAIFVVRFSTDKKPRSVTDLEIVSKAGAGSLSR